MKDIAREKLFPLSLSQLNILNLERALAGTSVNNISTTVRIRGRVDFVALQQSINRVVESDPSLRTQLVNVDGEMMQYHAPFSKEEFPVYDFTNTSGEGIENWENAVTRELIPLEGGPLYRFVLFRDSENSGGILVKLHHIISDGWSQIMICNKIGKTYLELLKGDELSLDETPDYRLHVQEELDYMSSKAYSRDESYWKSIVENIGEPSSLKNISGASTSPVGRRMSFELPQIINHAIFSFCEEKRVAPFAVFYMALAIYFKRNGGADRFTIGVPIFNRTSYEFKQSTGMFVTTLPFYNEIDDSWTLNTFNEDLMDKWYELLRHQRYPYSKICELSNKEGRLFNIALSYQDSKIYESRDASVHLSGRWHYCGYQAEQLTIHLTNLKDHQQYAVDYDYLAQYFTETEITALHNNLCHILSEALSSPDSPIHSLNVLSLEEKEKVLYTFNKTEKYLEDRSVYEAVLKNSRKYLNRAAIIHNGERMTYGTLLHRSAQFASAISEAVNGENELVAIMLPRKFDLPAAMLGTLQQEHAFILLSDSLPKERIKTILNKSGAALLITDESGKKRLGECDTTIITLDVVDEAYGIPTIRPQCEEMSKGDKLAYVVYTSGSTGEPKGVEITQRNLLNLCEEMKSVYASGAVLSVCNVGFDAFMLESIVALVNGRTIVFPTNSDLESPERLAELMNSYAVGFFSMTPSRLSVLLSNKTFKKVMWRMESIVCGGEHFPTELLKKLKMCTNARIYNQYGPSETTVAVSMKELSHADKITIGTPMGNCKMYVLDQWLNPLPIGGSGRLFVGGKCVGNGYRNNSELTDKMFRRNPFVSNDRIYDTGDIAYWTPNGEIVLTGRADSQIKLRGLRIELGEIASCVESFTGVLSAYAKICKVNDTEEIGVYYCSETELNESDLLAHTATYLPEYMIPSFVLRIDSMPMNANGKIDESALPIPCFDDEIVYDQLSQNAELILEIFKKVLNNDSIHGGSDFFKNGGNSLNAMQCVMEIEESLSKKLRIADLYACRTAVKLSAYLNGEAPHPISRPTDRNKLEISLVKTNKRSAYPLSAIQQGIYVQSMLDTYGYSYNMCGAFKLEKMPDLELLENAFVTLIKEDAIFRTAFVQTESGVVARILDNVCFKLETVLGNSFEEASKNFVRPFNLSEAPLLRAGIWTSPLDESYLFVDSHHIIGDGLTTPIILQRIDKAYKKEATNVECDYYDYLDAINKDQKNTEMLEYWKTHLESLPEKLELVGDLPRPKKFDYKGKTYEVLLSEKESRALEAYCQENGITEYSILLASYAMLLSAVSGKKDILIGAPVAGRDIVGTSKVCGPFINTLPLRLKLNGEMTVEEWLRSVSDEVTSMLDNQHVTLEEIINVLSLPRGEQNALYQVMMTQSPVNVDRLSVGDVKMELMPINTGSVKMDMILELSKKNDRVSLGFSYATSLFKNETIEFYANCIRNIASELIKEKNTLLSDVRIMTAEDQEKYLDAPNYKVTPFLNRPIHKILQSTIALKRDETAVIYHGERVTFEKIEKRASRIADYIEQKGIEKGECVALCLKRTPDMIAAMYGVLKAGCTYMFVLDSFPKARINYMMQDSGARLMLIDENVTLPENLVDNENVFEIILLPLGESVDQRRLAPTNDSVCNVLFTSGSTGRPKGVKLRHRSVSNLYSQMKALLSTIEGNVLCSTNSVFDCFVVETLIALALGRTVVLADEEEMMLPWKLASLVETYQTSVFEMTPARLSMCLENEAFQKAAKYIKIVLLGGEVVTDRLVNKFYDHSDGMLMNMYGPTEATVFTTMEHLRRGEHITIGSPLQNTRTYVLDENMSPVIPTGCGEMYIAGECLSSGYIGRDDLTNESFVDDILFSGEKMYRSGDIVRLRLDGRFDYIGRRDQQVKLNGQRVELSEINVAIESLAENVQASTVALKKEDGSMELCTFYTADPSLTDAKIFESIKKVLPPYMIPSRIIWLDKMPLTATNKIDVMTLREMASKRHTVILEKTPIMDDNDEITTIAEPKRLVNVNEEYVMSVWNSVLSGSVSDINASFFNVGGTSMGALNVLSRFYNDKLEMSLSEFYQNQTIADQVRFFNADGKTLEAIEYCNEKKTLVSGATGFFGAHLVKELLEREEKDLICLLRDGDVARMKNTLAWYFGEEKAEEMMKRISVIKADISSSSLGMTEADYEELATKIDEIYHCAADVRHYASNVDEYMATNVGGTENMIAISKLSGSKFYHISTCSVSGECQNDVTFTENDLDVGQDWKSNIYVKSKYLAEKAVFEAIDCGLSAKIFRLGRLVGRETDGKFQKDPETNAFYLTMKGYTQLGVIPNSVKDSRIDLMPIDRSAREVVLLKNTDNTVFHIMNPEPPTLEKVFLSLNENNKIVNMNDFYVALRDNSSKIDGALWAILLNSINSNSINTNVKVTNEQTTETLKMLGAETSPIDVKTVLREFWKGE